MPLPPLPKILHNNDDVVLDTDEPALSGREVPTGPGKGLAQARGDRPDGQSNPFQVISQHQSPRPDSLPHRFQLQTG